MADVTLFANTRANIPTANPAGPQKLVINNHSDLSVAQGLPPKTELVRLGNTYEVAIATGSKFTHVAAWPTTLSEIHLYNGEAAGKRSYIIDSVWVANVATSMGAAGSYTLLGQLVSAPAAVPTDDTAQLIVSRSGKSTGASYTGRAKRAIHDTVAIADRWSVLGTSTAPGAATIGTAVYADVYGGWIIPPGAMFCANLVASTATGAACIGIVWHEVQLDLG